MAVGQLTPSLSPSGHLLYSCTFSATRPFIRMLELDEEEEACVRPVGRPALRSFPRLRVRPPPPPTRSLLSLMKSKWQFRSCTMVGRGRSVGLTASIEQPCSRLPLIITVKRLIRSLNSAMRNDSRQGFNSALAHDPMMTTNMPHCK